MPNKYTPEQLKERARVFLDAFAMGDPRAAVGLMMAAAVSGITEAEALLKIREYAK